MNVTRKEKKGEKKQTMEAECVLASKQQKDCRLDTNVRCGEGQTWQEGEENRCKKDQTAQVIKERYTKFTMRSKQQRSEQTKQHDERYYGR